MQSRSPVNFRAFLIVAAFITAAVFCAYLYMVSRAAGITVFVLYISALGAFTAVFAVKYKRNTVKLRVLLAFCIGFVFSVSAFSISVGYYESFENSIKSGGNHAVTGRVYAIDTHSGQYIFFVEDVTLDGIGVSGNMRVCVSPSDDNIADTIGCGDVLSFYDYISPWHLYSGGSINGDVFKTNVRYDTTVYSSQITLRRGSPKLKERFMTALRGLLLDNMDDRYGNIAFSMLTGDKHTLDSSIKSAFNAAGLGHIMAVSGLHIGFMVWLLDLLMSKAGRKTRFFVISGFLSVYCVIADFSPSVVRATIMAVVALLSVIVGGRRDMLSSLCLSYSLILAVRPLYLFELGFLFSFGSMFGIAMFANSFSRLMKKHGIHRKVSEAISSSVTVQSGILPVQMYFLHKISIYSTLVNIVLIPYMGAAFITIVLCTVFGAIPGLGGILLVPKYLLMPIDYIATGISHAPRAVMTVYPTAAVFLCYPVMFVASEFFMMPRGKLPVFLASVFAYVSFCAVGVSMPYGTMTVADCNSAETLLCENGRVYIVGDMKNGNTVKRMLDHNRCKSVDAIFMLEMRYDSVRTVLDIADEFDVKTVYCYEFGDGGAELIARGVNFVLIESEDDGFSVVKHDGKVIGYEHLHILFARSGTGADALSGYGLVRIKSISEPNDDSFYYCTSGEPAENVRTASGGSYIVDISSLI